MPVPGTMEGNPCLPGHGRHAVIAERASEGTRTSRLRGTLLGGLTAASVASLLAGRLMWGMHLVFEAAAMGCFIALMVLEARRRWLKASVVAVVASVLVACALVPPPRESADVWSYVMYGRIVLHEDNPYTTPPSHFPHDRWLHLVRPIWRNTPSLYGPLFNLTAAEVVKASDGSARRARLGFQLLAALALAGMMVLLWRRSRDPAVLACLGLNPLVSIGVVNGGHNDALVALAVLAGALLAERDRDGAAGFVIGLGALVKVVALLPAGVLTLWVWRRRGTREAIVSGSATAVTVAAGYLAVGGGAAWHALRAETGLTTRFSAWRLVTLLFDQPSDTPSHYLSLAPKGGLGWVPLATILVLAMLAALPGLRSGSPLSAVSLAVLVYLMGGLYVSPWYAIWVLPLMALAWPSRLTWLAIGHQGALTVAYALALHKHFGPLASAARVGYFDSLAVAQAVAVLGLAAWGVVSIVRGKQRPASTRTAEGPVPRNRPFETMMPREATVSPPSSSFRRR